ncbi:MAG: hypothetical protein ACOCRK_03200 [bacterium]
MRKLIIALCLVIIFFAYVLSFKDIIFKHYNKSTYSVSNRVEDYNFDVFHTNIIEDRDNNIKILYDIRVFTLFAFLNRVGNYDAERDGEIMTPERQRLRSDILKKLNDIDFDKVYEWRQFYEDNKDHNYLYLSYVLTLGSPPEFNHIVPKEQLDSKSAIFYLNGFNKVLSSFYKECDIEELYFEYLEEGLFDKIDEYDMDNIKEDISDMYSYLRMIDDKSINISIIPNSFDQHWSSYAIIFDKTLYIIDGHKAYNNGLNIHEYLHFIINPMVEKHMEKHRDNFVKVFEDNKDKELVRDNYNSVDAFVWESLIRALEHRIRIKQEPRLDFSKQEEYEASAGLVLVPYFSEQLKKYEDNDNISNIDEFINILLREYK